MRPLSYVRPSTVEEAIATVAADPNSSFLAGGTTEVDLVRLGVTKPDTLVDINRLPLADVTSTPDGGLKIGALSRMSDVARHPDVEARYPGMSRALLLGASEQLRNMASMGGNMLQRTRCAYFRDGVSACNKREPGTGCSALEGINRGHAILGTSDHCIALHPSDVAVPLVALDAMIHTMGPSGTRTFAIDDFFLLPGDTPDVEHPLQRGELITQIEVPGLPVAGNSIYLKFRDRQSYEFALTSVFAAIRVENGTVAEVRLALGGVGTKPWRARRVEQALIGGPATADAFAAAAAEEMRQAVTREFNAFKVELAERTIVRGLLTAMDGEER
jgi:xanthine dehydrogenase YagS FAD-binding subunit